MRVPDHVRDHILAHPAQAPRAAADALNIPLNSLNTYRSRLIRAGLLPPRWPRDRTDRALAWLRANPDASARALMVATGVGHNTAARARAIARDAGWLRANASDRLRRAPDLLTARPCDLARAYGVSAKTASRVQSAAIRLARYQRRAA